MKAKKSRYVLRKNRSIPTGKKWFEADNDWEAVLTADTIEELVKAAEEMSDYPSLLYDVVAESDVFCRYWISDDSCFYRTDARTNPTVYIDMDGTLCFWYPDGKGFAYPEEILNPEVHYYRDLDAHDYTVRLAKTLWEEGVDVCILSAADFRTIPDKVAWVNKNLPFLPTENVFFCPIGREKAGYGRRNAMVSVLIDDYHKNLDAWERWGGVAVKLITDQNSPDHTRFQLQCLDDGQEIDTKIASVRVREVLNPNENLLRNVQPTAEVGDNITAVKIPRGAYDVIRKRGVLSTPVSRNKEYENSDSELVRAWVVRSKSRGRYFLSNEVGKEYPLLPVEQRTAKALLERAKVEKNREEP